jgi:hypothetical protein
VGVVAGCNRLSAKSGGFRRGWSGYTVRLTATQRMKMSRSKQRSPHLGARIVTGPSHRDRDRSTETRIGRIVGAEGRARRRAGALSKGFAESCGECISAFRTACGSGMQLVAFRGLLRSGLRRVAECSSQPSATPRLRGSSSSFAWPVCGHDKESVLLPALFGVVIFPDIEDAVAFPGRDDRLRLGFVERRRHLAHDRPRGAVF